MSEYIVPIKMAFLFFPLVAFFMTIPYMLIQYRKYGSVPGLRTLVVYSFVLYLLTAYFLVILPLPPLSEVAHYTTPRMQLVPFQFVTDIIRESQFVWSNPSTYIEIVTNRSIYQVLYNILMILPLGFYLRYYFKKNLWQTMGLSFLLSLFFELTQLSGLYGIYPRGYRLFDIDDLMINTFGGMVGYVLTPCISWILPSKDQLDHISYERGKQISLTRRLFAFFIDGFVLLILSSILYIPNIMRPFEEFFNLIGLSLRYVLTIIIYFMILLPIMHGSSIGKRIVKIKVADINNDDAKWWQFVIRYGILYLILLPTPLILASLLTQFQINIPMIHSLLILLSGLLIVMYVCFFIEIVVFMFHKNKLLFYEKFSHTKNVSTIKFVRFNNKSELKVENSSEFVIDEKAKEKNELSEEQEC